MQNIGEKKINKVLLIETIAATPHTETGLEIVIKEALAGSDVTYVPLFACLSNMLWRGNIGGAQREPKDSEEDWLDFVIQIIQPYATIDLDTVSKALSELPLAPNLPAYKHIYSDFRDFGTLTQLPSWFNPLKFEYKNLMIRELVESNVAQIYNTANLGELLPHIQPLCTKIALTAIATNNALEVLVQKYKPNLIYFFNGRTATSWPIYKFCEERNIRAMIYERGSRLWKYHITSKPFQYFDTVIKEIQDFSRGRSPDIQRLSAAAFYARQRTGALTSSAYKNLGQDHIDLEKIKAFGPNYVGYFASSNHEIYAMPGNDASNGLGSQLDAVTSLAQICHELKRLLIIRLHPNTPKPEINDYDHLKELGAKIIYPESKVSSYLLGQHADFNFSYGSTITWEFHFNQIPCATLGRSYGSTDDSVIELSSKLEIENYLKKGKAPPPSDSFALKVADYLHNFGSDFDYFKPDTLFTGTFSSELIADRY